MKKTFPLTLTFLFVCLVLSGCGDEEPSLLLQVWEDSEGNLLEFDDKGSYYAKATDSKLMNWGTWRITDEGKLEMGYSNPPLITFEYAHDYELRGDTLTIMGYRVSGQAYVYKRASNQSPLHHLE